MEDKLLEITDADIDEVEKLLDYFNTFFSNSKREEINLINKKLSEMKKKTILELKLLNKFFDEDEFYDFDEMLENSKKIKYKDSCFFMAIYNIKKNNEILGKS